MAATRNSGASEAKGASHWTSRNSSTPNSVPVCTSPSAKGSAAARIASAAKTKSAAIAVRRRRLGSEPIVCAGPISSGSSVGARATKYMYAANTAVRITVS